MQVYYFLTVAYLVVVNSPMFKNNNSNFVSIRWILFGSLDISGLSLRRAIGIHILAVFFNEYTHARLDIVVCYVGDYYIAEKPPHTLPFERSCKYIVRWPLILNNDPGQVFQPMVETNVVNVYVISAALPKIRVVDACPKGIKRKTLGAMLVGQCMDA